MSVEAVEDSRRQGNQFFQQREYAKAVGAWNKGLKAEPSNAVLLCNRAAAFLALDKDVRALKDLEACVAASPKWVKAHYRMGMALHKLKRYDDALQALLNAADLDPNSKEVLGAIKDTLAAHPDSKSKNAMVRKRLRLARGELEQAPSVPSTTAPAPAPAPSAAAASEPEASSEVPVSSGEEYENALKGLRKGDAIEYSEGLVEGFRTRVTSLLGETFTAGAPLKPVVYFQPGFVTPEEDGGMCCVGTDHAYDSPEMLAQCSQFLRTYGEDMKALACMAVIPKTTVAYPQVWKGAPKANWPFKVNQDGLFLQLECRAGKRVWFWAFNRKGALEDSPTEIGERMAMLPALLAS